MNDFIMFAPFLASGIGIAALLLCKDNSPDLDTERLFPTSTNPILNKIYHSYESVKKDEYKERDGYEADYNFYVEKYNTLFLLYEMRTKSDFYIIVDNNTVFCLTTNNETHEILELNNKKNILTLEESSTFVQAFHYFLWMIKNKEAEKVAKEKDFQDTVKDASKQMLFHKTVDEKVLSNHEELMASFHDQDIVDRLKEIENKRSYIELYRNQLNTEQLHTYERVSTAILPDILRSFLGFSEAEQTEHKNDLLKALTNVTKEIGSIESAVKHSKVLDFQKKIALIKD